MQSQVARPGLAPATGYFRLSLSAIDVEGRQVALQTSALFARGTSEPGNVLSSGSASDRRPDGVQVKKGRRLTFRLIAPVTLDDSSSMANRQAPGTAPE